MSCPSCVCARCDALTDAGFRDPPLEPTILVALWAQVDRETRKAQAIRVTEAVGHFFRSGEPGPSRFPIPVAEAVGRFFQAFRVGAEAKR